MSQPLPEIPPPPSPAAPVPPSPPDTGWLSWLNAVKGLTVTNVLVIAMLAVIAIPSYVVWRALGDEELMDRFFSNYRELTSQNVGCTIREAKYRGGSPSWAISTGFAFTGRDRYIISVVLDHEPNLEEINSYCEAVKLMADRMLGRDAAGGDDAAQQ